MIERILKKSILVILIFNAISVLNNKTIVASNKKYLDKRSLANQEFINAAIEDSKETGVYASITLGQAAYESGWAKSNLSSVYNNYFGMTAKSQDCKEGTVTKFESSQNQFWDGTAVCMCNSAGCRYWRVYASASNSIKDHSRNLWCNGRYVKNGVFEFENANYSPELQIGRIAPIYTSVSEGPNYANKVLGIINENNFRQYDTEHKKIKPAYAETCSDAVYTGNPVEVGNLQSTSTKTNQGTTTYTGDITKGYIYVNQDGYSINYGKAANEEQIKSDVNEIIKEIFSNAAENSDKTGAQAYQANVTYLNGTFRNQIIYHNQTDYKDPYGSFGTISSHGCGPTSMAIVVSSFRQQAVSPIETTNWACSNGYCSSSGSYHSLICAEAQNYGLSCEGELSPRIPANQQKVIDALSSGNSLVVVLAHEGYFTTGGHFFVLTGVEGNEISIADPADRNKSQKKFTFDFLINPTQGHIDKMWIITG